MKSKWLYILYFIRRHQANLNLALYNSAISGMVANRRLIDIDWL